MISIPIISRYGKIRSFLGETTEDWFMIIQNNIKMIRANYFIFVYCYWLYDSDYFKICSTEF